MLFFFCFGYYINKFERKYSKFIAAIAIYKKHCISCFAIFKKRFLDILLFIKNIFCIFAVENM